MVFHVGRVILLVRATRLVALAFQLYKKLNNISRDVGFLNNKIVITMKIHKLKEINFCLNARLYNIYTTVIWTNLHYCTLNCIVRLTLR